MNELASQCIHDHRNPLVKVNLPAQKLFYSSTADEDKSFINSYQDQLKAVLSHKRVERRCNRASVIWLPEKNLGKVDKVVKNLLKFFGFQNRDGIFLYPEEVLFLLETNRAEVTLNNSSLSIQDGYGILLATPNLNLVKYRVYKKLANLGYKVIRYENREKMNQKNRENTKKRKLSHSEDLEQEEATCSKKLNDGEVPQGDTKIRETSKAEEYIEKIFKEMREKAPRNISNNIEVVPDFCAYIPNKNEEIINIIIWDGDSKSIGLSNKPEIYALCSDDVSFYKFTNTETPVI
ncbi:uncharacterized protein LOC115881064 [Sitophilus oryzae]|uniref:Uncharacterized protein LOC115881064 n=1 Tax=Sitophilus oryzae TaxID=7048 RepID=A0A6J2XS05_SITOR|nr:uncharacterized protein LOC115881064 [Sitophilus oryzae]